MLVGVLDELCPISRNLKQNSTIVTKKLFNTCNKQTCEHLSYSAGDGTWEPLQDATDGVAGFLISRFADLQESKYYKTV